MAITVELYLHFGGEAKTALAYYEELFGVAHDFLLINKDIPGYPVPEHQKEWVAHASFRLGNMEINLGDQEEPVNAGSRVAVMLRQDAIDSVRAMYEKFVHSGAETIMPFTETFYSPGYAVVRDRFGVVWHLYTNGGESS